MGEEEEYIEKFEEIGLAKVLFSVVKVRNNSFCIEKKRQIEKKYQ
jgi:hypothetical protein